MRLRSTMLTMAVFAGSVAACEGVVAMPTRLVCEEAIGAEPALCDLFAQAVTEARPDWQIAQPGQTAKDELKLVVVKQDHYGIKARLEWAEGNNPRKIGPEFELSAMDRSVTAGMAKGFLLRLLDYSKVGFGWE